MVLSFESDCVVVDNCNMIIESSDNYLPSNFNPSTVEQSSLRITEIFHSLQGESSSVGFPTGFIRLTGCPLRCQYCDTSYAFKGGRMLGIASILAEITRMQVSYVCVTGGEPLAQPNCLKLLKTLADHNYNVSLETSGAQDLSLVDKRVRIIMDIKTPGSLMCHLNLWGNLEHLQATDEIKFVLCNRLDYEWAISVIKKYNLTSKYQVLFSPSFAELSPQDLATWILEDRLKVRLQIQLHKILWQDSQGR
jgi:7-carboxy-7-deazaguanine synthase